MHIFGTFIQVMGTLGRSSQIFKLRQYKPYICRIKENHKESALAKFHAYVSNTNTV